MAGIYTRDNVNYSQMLQNAIANRARNAERQAQYIQNQGKLWGDAATNVGKYLGRGIFATADSIGDEDEAELAHLKEIKAEQEQKAYEEEIQKAYDAQVEQRKKFDEIFNNPEKLAKEQAERESYINKQINDYADYKPNGTYDMTGYRPFDTREGAYIAPQVGGAESVAMNGYNPILNHNPSISEIQSLAYRDKMKGIYGEDVPANYPEDYYTDPYYYGLDLSNPYSNSMQNYYRRGR